MPYQFPFTNFKAAILGFGLWVLVLSYFFGGLRQGFFGALLAILGALAPFSLLFSWLTLCACVRWLRGGPESNEDLSTLKMGVIALAIYVVLFIITVRALEF